MLNKKPEYLTNKELNEYLKKSILHPYLIHIENEILNIKFRLKNDLILREIITRKGYSIQSIDKTIDIFLETTETILNILKFYH